MNARTSRLVWPIWVLTFAPIYGQGDLRTFISPDQTFKFNMPAGYELYTGKNKPGLSYIPMCHDQSIVCVAFPSNRYSGTTFEAASFEVALTAAKAPQACTTAEFKIDAKQPSRLINGVRFDHSLDGGGVSSHDAEIHRYRAFKNGRCYSLAIQVSYTNFAVYDPGTIKEFTRRDSEQVTKELTAILDSFKILR